MKNRKNIGKGTYFAALAVMVLLFSSSFFGLSSWGSGLRVGYSDRFTGSSWEARYMLHQGFRERTVNVGNQPAMLHVEIATDEGTFGIIVTDMEGTVLLEESFTDSRSFDIEIPGRVTVRVKGTEHKGSFKISW